MMQPLFKMWDDHTETVTKLEEEVKAIPNVIASLKESQQLLGKPCFVLFSDFLKSRNINSRF